MSFLFTPTDTQVNCLKDSFKIYTKINFNIGPTCLGVVTPSPGSALFLLAIASKNKVCEN